MLAQQIIAPARVLAKDPPPGTYSNESLLGQLDLVCLDLINKVKFPYARISTSTVANLQEYMLPETPIDDGTGCVYLNGQLLTKTDVATLQGQQISVYDQTGFGTPTAGGGGPTANAGSFVPSWTVAPPTSFPIPNYQSIRDFAAPWSPGSGLAPRYYLRGGSIGIVPAPNASAQVVDGVAIPNLVIDMCMSWAYVGPFTWNGSITQTPSLQSVTSRIWYPSNFQNALTWGLAERIATADDTNSTKETRNFCGQKYRDEVNQLLFWARSYRSDDRIKRQTNRSRYVGSTWARNPQYGGGGYP